MYMCCFINTVLKLSLTATEMHMGIKRIEHFHSMTIHAWLPNTKTPA